MARRISSYDRAAKTPLLDSEWVWREENGDRENITVIDVRWNGEEWWVQTDGSEYGPAWTDLTNFWEHARKCPKKRSRTASSSGN